MESDVPDGWDVIDEELAVRGAPVERIVSQWTPEQRHLAFEAAKLRGISLPAYVSRAVMALASYDTGHPWTEVMDDETLTRGFGAEDGELRRGTQFGMWEITGLR